VQSPARNEFLFFARHATSTVRPRTASSQSLPVGFDLSQAAPLITAGAVSLLAIGDRDGRLRTRLKLVSGDGELVSGDWWLATGGWLAGDWRLIDQSFT
jgi:hypothetical protein